MKPDGIDTDATIYVWLIILQSLITRKWYIVIYKFSKNIIMERCIYETWAINSYKNYHFCFVYDTI